eukprot:4103370-Amphidinium_carterae.1
MAFESSLSRNGKYSWLSCSRSSICTPNICCTAASEILYMCKSNVSSQGTALHTYCAPMYFTKLGANHVPWGQQIDPLSASLVASLVACRGSVCSEDTLLEPQTRNAKRRCR